MYLLLVHCIYSCTCTVVEKKMKMTEIGNFWSLSGKLTNQCNYCMHLLSKPSKTIWFLAALVQFRILVTKIPPTSGWNWCFSKIIYGTKDWIHSKQYIYIIIYHYIYVYYVGLQKQMLDMAEAYCVQSFGHSYSFLSFVPRNSVRWRWRQRSLRAPCTRWTQYSWWITKVSWKEYALLCPSKSQVHVVRGGCFFLVVVPRI